MATEQDPGWIRTAPDAPGWTTAELEAFTPSGGSVRTERTRFVQDQHDTPGRLLRSLGLDLSRQGRGPHPGWTLRSTEAAEPLVRRSGSRRRTPPRTLLTGLPERLGDLVPVGSTSTDRVRHTLTDADGEPLVELTEDRVRASAEEGGAAAVLWVRVTAVGAAGTELAGQVAARVPRPATGDPGAVAPDRDAPEDVLAGYVREHSRRVLRGWLLLHEEVDARQVHRTRTAARRLRATLRSFPDAFEDARQAEKDLARLAATLAGVRDTDVLTATLLPEAETLSADGPDPELAGELREHLRRRREQAGSDWRTATTDAWTRRCLNQLLEWLEQPPHGGRLRAGRTLARAEERVRRRVRAARARPEELHRARKAAKHWRYTAELLAGRPKAAGHRKRARKVQRRLGALQDDLVAAAALQDAAVEADGRTGFGYGLLAARARERAQEVARVSRSWW